METARKQGLHQRNPGYQQYGDVNLTGLDGDGWSPDVQSTGGTLVLGFGAGA